MTALEPPACTPSLLIGGAWHASARTLEVRNPWSGALLARVAAAGTVEAEAAIASAVRGRAQMRALPSHRRAEILRRSAAAVAAQAEDYAQLIVAEAGKPVAAARREVARCVNTLELCAGEALRLAGETINFDSFPGGENRSGYFVYEPRGIVVAVTPFNDPLNLVAHKLGPAIAGGNAVILKPSEQAPFSALRLAGELLAAGLPPEGLNVLTGYGAEFGSALVAHPEVALVSFTGGEAAGGRIAAAAGAKRLAMELGSNSPVIVTERCDFARAVRACVAGSFSAAGQNCIGVQRIYVQERIYDAFLDAFLESAGQLVCGDPADPRTDVGPLISAAHRERVAGMVEQSLRLGARLLLGGKAEGNLYPPTVLDQLAPDAPLACEEIFGPVVGLFRYRALDDAIRAANRADALIHAAIFTNDIAQAMQATRELQAAGVIVNDSTDYRLDAMPFGGAGRGAIGREGARAALLEMVQTKVVCFTLEVA